MKHAQGKFLPVAPRHSTLLDAELPAADGQPLLKLQVHLDTEIRGDGEETRLRVHLQSCLGHAASAISRHTPKQTAALPKSGERSLRTRSPSQRVAALVQRSLNTPLLRRAAAPLMRHDLNTWIDVRASTAPLMRGAAALMPRYADKLRQIGVQLPPGNAPLAHTWIGPATGTNAGQAQFSILRFDKRHLPGALAVLLGDKPFQIVATMAQVLEERDPRSE